jgi:hypothetical protein
MTRLMYDGINAAGLPATGAQLVAGYVDGNWPSLAAITDRFPHLTSVGIAVSASFDGGTVLDVETGDATAEQAVNWVLMRRAAKVDPSVYCNTSTWPSVKAAFATHDVTPPHYWVADYDGVATVPAGAVAKQYANHSGYDVSVVADYWPGVDPAPVADPGSAAVRELQTEINATDHAPKLAVDGDKGPLTVAGFIWVMARSAMLREGSGGIEVAVLQAMLNTWGGYALAVDGSFGAKTKAAVEAFQEAHPACRGVDGIVGPMTKAALAA